MPLFSFFRRHPVVGLDISDASAEVLTLDRKRAVKGYRRAVLAPGMVEDGVILKPDDLAGIIKELFAGINVSSPRVIASIPESKTFIHLFRVPGSVDPDELDRLVEEEARKIIPFGPEEVYHDAFVFRHAVQADQAVLYAAAPKEIVDSYAAVIKKAGAHPAVFDLESASLGRSLLPAGYFEKLTGDREGLHGTMILDIGARTTTAGVFDRNGILILSVSIPSAGERFTDAVVSSLSVAREEAERMKRTFGFDGANAENKALPALEQVAADIIHEAEALCAYYEEHWRERVGEIILAGGSALIPHISGYLGAKLSRDTRIGDPLRQIKEGFSTGRDSPHPIFFANVIGLALRGAQDMTRGINLAPADAGHNTTSFFPSSSARDERKKTSPPSEPEKQTLGRASRAPIASPPRDFLPTASLRSARGIGAAVFVLIMFSILGWVIYRYMLISVGPGANVLPSLPSPGASLEMSVSPSIPVATETPIAESPSLLVAHIVITETPTGWLNVRQGPGTSFPQITRVNPGERFELLAEQDGWYKIKVSEEQEGWVVGEYAKKEE